ncbi:glycoside hydrolase family 95 protein [Desertivirga arenae]|uniref:glycoside hydrolase family 95 protein n=1 Tax=Desertivirga arenae TaxID=2810309 RepID=UPI001A95C924|nr:glycoside hydrolase N-terminal domain-containing protein [Pedobacter sp. SYSU D00823]
MEVLQNLTKKLTYLVTAVFLTSSSFVFGQDNYSLWYKQPAVKWTDALAIGNGRIGGMVFGGLDKDRIQFNEETLWTGEPRNYNRQGAYQYLPQIRQLLAEGKQKEAEKLAEEQFMGQKSNEGKREGWLNDMRGLKGMEGNPALPNFDDSKWQTFQVPTYEGWESAGWEGMDGAVWFRTSFNLPAKWVGKNIVLDLNRIRDEDFTYVNGTLIGHTSNPEGRKYVIPKESLKAGKNVISIQVLNYNDKGGIAGYKDTTRHIAVYPEGMDAAKGISLNGLWKYKIQNDEPPAVGKYQADYQPFGDLFLNFKNTASATNYRRELDLSTAIAKTSYTSGGVDYTREYLVSQPQQSLVVHLSANKGASISFEAVLGSPHKKYSVKKIDNNTLALSLQVRNGVLRGESFLRIETSNGNVSVSDNGISVSNADDATLFLTAATNYVSYKDVSGNAVAKAQNDLSALKGMSYDKIRKEHIKEYQQYYNTFSVNFGSSNNEALPTDQRLANFATSKDPSFVALYMQYGRYLLISSSRPGTRPANLQGIWNDLLSPPWGSKYTTNINAEMNYWPAEVLNLSPMHQALFSMIKDLSEAGKETAKEYYNASGWLVHHNTDIWRGTAPINSSTHGIWVGGGGWLSQHLWEHYQYTQDKEFLRNEAYPIMKSAASFFVDFLVKDPKTGWLISTPGNSPENGGLVAGPAMDHQIIRTLFRNTIEASKLLNVDVDFSKDLQSKLSQIAPNQIGKYGQLQEWLEDKDDTTNKHRHVSHLWGVHPGDDVTWEKSPELMTAARQSLIYRGDEATGWSLAWKINFWARFKDGDHAMNMIKLLLRPATGNAGSYTNLFDAHPPFQIDGNFGAPAGVAEMLVQSHEGYIELLPALSSDLADGSIKGIKARGGFELSMNWKNGKLSKVQVVSAAGNKCTLKYSGKEVSFKTKKGKKYNFNGSLKSK